ncbi:MAG TPA: DNRLRE domain-containing protein [bacterium]|nr:DNRLRE domain-containing protein [bacterium]
MNSVIDSIRMKGGWMMKYFRWSLTIGVCVIIAGVLLSRAPELVPAGEASPDRSAGHEWAANDSLFPLIHAQNPGNTLTGEPYLSQPDVTIQWECTEAYNEYRVEVSSDEAFTTLIASLRGNSSPCRVPRDVLGMGGRFFYRIQVRTADGKWSDYSMPRWFVWDRRLTGNRVIPFGDHPYGKTESSILVKDAWGRLHLVMQHDHGDSDRRDLFWWVSEDNGASWRNAGCVNRPEDSFPGPSSVALDPSGRFLVAGYLGGDDATCPKPVVICTCDLTAPEPRFDHHAVMPGDIGEAVRRPFITVDSKQRIHAVWDGYAGGKPQRIHGETNECFYARCVDGQWQPIQRLSSHQKRWFRGAGTLAVAGDELHAVWSQGVTRVSVDGGATWDPPLTEPPREIFQEFAADRGFHWWQITTTAVPGTDRLAAVLVARFTPDGMDKGDWTGWMNLRAIYISEYTTGAGWATPRLLQWLDDPLSETAAPAEGQPFCRMERPDISADGTGCLYVVWDETRGIGPDRSGWTRNGYICVSDENGEFGTVEMLPSIGGLHSMKPTLAEASLHAGCQVTWFVGEMIPDDLRRFRYRDTLALLGVAVADTLDTVEYSGYRGYLGEYRLDRDTGSGNYEMEGFPNIPMMPMKYSAVTTTYTPPPTPPPTPTPKPTVIYEVSTVGDATVDYAAGSQNFGYETTLTIAAEPDAKAAYMKFPIPRKKAGQTFESARLRVHRAQSGTGDFSYYIGHCSDRWWEDTITADTVPGPMEWGYPNSYFGPDQWVTIEVDTPVQDAWLENTRYISFYIEGRLETEVFDSKESGATGAEYPVQLELTVRGDFGSSQSPANTPTPAHSYWIACPARADATVDLTQPDENFGHEPQLVLQGRHREALLRYWLPDLPPDYLVSADILLNVDEYPDWETALNLYAVTGAWDEDALTYATRPGSEPVIHDLYLEKHTGMEVLTVTNTVRDWLETPETEYGVRLTSWDYYGTSDNETVRLSSREGMNLPLSVLRLNQVDEPVDIDLRLDQTTYRAGDTFTLSMLLANYRDVAVNGQLWLMLDVYGQYFFYPTWGLSPDYILQSYPANYLTVDTLMEFQWPAGAGAAQGIKFWAAFIDDETGAVTYDFVQFGWE